MGIDREESLFLTVSEDHSKRKYPEYILLMSDPYRKAGGMIAALRLMTDGMRPKDAVALNITNKCFDEYEYQLVQDVVMTRFI